MIGKKSLLFALSALIWIAASGADAQKLGKAERKAIETTPDQIATSASVANDELDTVIKISTEPFFQEKQGLLKIVNADKFMRAFVDKKTGVATYQVYLWTRLGGGWQFFNRVNYATAGGPVSAEARSINQQVQDCSKYGCVVREDLAFEVPESTLREIAATASAGSDESWKFRVYGQRNDGVTTGVLKTEVAGILIAVDRERAKLNLKQ